MTSRIIRPVERSVITFPGGIGVSNTIYLARRINVAAYREVTAYFRMHPGSVNSPTPTTSNFIINADGFTDEDPGANDATSAPAFQVQLVATDVKSMAAGQMKTVAVPANFGSMLSLSWTMTSSAVGALNCIISVDLVCKEF